MNDYRNFCEFVKRPDDSARLRTLRAVLMTIYTVITLAYIVFFYFMLRQWQLLLLLPFIMYALIALTWRFTKPEYEYSIEAGTLTIAIIYGGKSRRVRCSLDLTKATRISEFKPGLVNSRDVVSAKDYSAGGEVWCVFMPDRDSGKKQAVIFSVNDEMKRIMKLCNPPAVV